MEVWVEHGLHARPRDLGETHDVAHNEDADRDPGEDAAEVSWLKGRELLESAVSREWAGDSHAPSHGGVLEEARHGTSGGTGVPCCMDRRARSR